MATLQLPFTVNTSGHIIAVDVPEDVYMQQYAEDFCEWVDGTVIKMSPTSTRYDLILQYLIILFNAYFEVKPIGTLRHETFVMRYKILLEDGNTKRRNREPDIQIILNDNENTLHDTYMDGAADIVIEVVSLESSTRDYGEKFHEYEQVGVPEYWIIDPLKKECRFYHLNAQRAYVLQAVEDDYESPHLPALTIHVPTLWRDKLPGPMAVVKSVQAMLST